MIKKLVSFGCSWPHGVELEHPDADAYPALIAKHNGWILEDQTRVNTTLNESVSDFWTWLHGKWDAGENLDEYLVLVGLTHETSDKGHTEDEMFELSVAAFDSLAKQEHVKLIQFNVLARQHKLKFPTLIESSSALEMLVIRDKPRKDPLFTEHKFPNEKGHIIISEFLINKIDSVILNE